MTLNEYTVIRFDIPMNRAVRTEPDMKSLVQCRIQCSKLTQDGELAMVVHQSTLSCIGMFDKEQFELI